MGSEDKQNLAVTNAVHFPIAERIDWQGMDSGVTAVANMTDMLGEAATMAAAAELNCRDYEIAIDAIGKASAGRGIYADTSFSIELSDTSELCARPSRRLMAELLPEVKALAVMLENYDIGLNIDAEEPDCGFGSFRLGRHGLRGSGLWQAQRLCSRFRHRSCRSQQAQI